MVEYRGPPHQRPVNTAAVGAWAEHGRMTLWLAPDLGCFALKVTYEEQRPDGTFHLVNAKQGLKVTLNP